MHALETIWEFVRRINRYVQQTQVWTLAKPDTKPRMGTILYNSLEALRDHLCTDFTFHSRHRRENSETDRFNGIRYRSGMGDIYL